jgi:hypothetical protein
VLCCAVGWLTWTWVRSARAAWAAWACLAWCHLVHATVCAQGPTKVWIKTANTVGGYGGLRGRSEWMVPGDSCAPGVSNLCGPF